MPVKCTLLILNRACLPSLAAAGRLVGTAGLWFRSPRHGHIVPANATVNPAQAITLTLTNLPAHTFLGLNFLLAIIDQWDGIDLHDAFNVSVDGTPAFAQTYTNYAGGEAYAGTRLSFNCRCGVNATSDSAYAVSLSNIPHPSSNATIRFFRAVRSMERMTTRGRSIRSK